MSHAVIEVLDLALKLPETERELIVRQLVASLEHHDPGYDEAYEAEIARRLEDIRSGKVELIPWEVVRKELMGEEAPED